MAQIRKDVAKAWNVEGARTHGHHLVHKVGASNLTPAGLAANDDSQRILAAFGVDLLDAKADVQAAIDSGETLHNLVIAPYVYVHSSEYTQAVNKILKAAEATAKALPYNADGSVSNEQRELITNALKKIADKIQEGKKLPWP